MTIFVMALILLVLLPKSEAVASNPWTDWFLSYSETEFRPRAVAASLWTKANSLALFNPDSNETMVRGDDADTVSPDWGLLASEAVGRQEIKGIFFFAGNWRCCQGRPAGQFYEYPVTSNEGLYTVHPADARHLGWSEQPENPAFALDTMIEAGANVVLMSYWGEPGSDRWAYWAPMQTSTLAHDQLFSAAAGKNILIMPVIESGNATIGCGGRSPAYHFTSDFPGSKKNPAPQLVSQIEDLVRRYLQEPANPAWPNQWAQMYDRTGHKRYAINILHVASNMLAADEHERFARGFDLVAHKVYQDTGVLVGFTLDLLPAKHLVNMGNCGASREIWDTFTPTPGQTGPYLRQQVSFLAVQAFLPEIWTGYYTQDDLLAYKSTYLQSWIAQGVPVILDVSPGYDGHFIFPGSKRYGYSEGWRTGLSALRAAYPVRGITFNTWNGYTEGTAAVSTLEYGDTTFQWLQELFSGGDYLASQ